MSHTIGQVKEDNQQSTSSSSPASKDSSAFVDKTPESVSLLSDADYEFLFNQLLEGIAHGWHDRRIDKFFKQLGERGKPEGWVAWLERLRVKLITFPIQSKQQLGTVMIRLGELTRSTPGVKEIGFASNRIGRELLFGNTEDVIWEYVGSDVVVNNSDNPSQNIEDIADRLPTDFSELGKSANEEAETSNLVTENTTKSKSSAEVSEHNSSDRLESEDLVSNLNLEQQTTTHAQELDFDSDDSTPSSESKRSTAETLPDSKSDPVAIDLELVMNLIEQDPALAQEISQKLKITPSPSTPEGGIADSLGVGHELSTTTELDNSSVELIEGWFNLGLKQVSGGEFDKAIVSWEKALKINPNLSEAWHNRGSALGRLGEYQQAVDSFEKALKIDPKNQQAWNDRAHALYQMQKWSEAADSWSNAVKLTPGNHLFWYNRGCALEQLESWAEAIASYEKCLEIKPDFQPARLRYTNLVADSSHVN